MFGFLAPRHVGSGIQPTSPALEAEGPTTAPPGKSLIDEKSLI